jgi:tetratricopeptide (TPR) repeat protein
MDQNLRWELVEEAIELLREKDYSGAERELNDAIKRDPGNPYAWNFLGVLHFERTEFDKSLAAYREAIRLSPRYLGAILGMAHSLRMLGKLDEAIAISERTLKLVHTETGVEDADLHWLLALAYAAKGKVDAAIRHAEQFLSTHPELEARAEAEALLQSLRLKVRPLKSVD